MNNTTATNNASSVTEHELMMFLNFLRCKKAENDATDHIDFFLNLAMLAMVLHTLGFVLKLIKSFFFPKTVVFGAESVQKLHYRQVVKELEKHGNVQDLAYNGLAAQSALKSQKESGNAFAGFCLAVINGDKIEPLEVHNAASLDMNFVLFFLSKGDARFFEVNRKFGESSVSIDGCAAAWVTESIKKNYPDFFNNNKK